jgi:hypothetical protein
MHPEYQALVSPRVFNHVGVTTMKRLGQGHPHPKLEVPRLTCPGRESLEQLTNFAIRNLYSFFTLHLIMFISVESTEACRHSQQLRRGNHRSQELCHHQVISWLPTCVVDPWHFGKDPDPDLRIFASDQWIRIRFRILVFSSLTFKTPTKNYVFLSFFAYSFLRCIYIIFLR